MQKVGCPLRNAEKNGTKLRLLSRHINERRHGIKGGQHANYEVNNKTTRPRANCSSLGRQMEPSYCASAHICMGDKIDLLVCMCVYCVRCTMYLLV